jgi:ElaB/YqjD/DUF883 family membrane-anchored ribosome-binding protein
VAYDLRAERGDSAISDMEVTMENRMDDKTRRGSGGDVGRGWTESESRDIADAARQRMQDAKTYATDAKEYAQGAVEHTREYVQGARDYVEGAVQQARDKVAEYREGGFERVKNDVAGYTREQPMTALLIATGAGLVLGWLSAAGRR